MVSTLKAKKSTMEVAFVVALYWFVSISLVYTNKFLVSSNDMTVPAPMFVTWFQCVFTCIVCQVCSYMGQNQKSAPVGIDSFFTQFPKMIFSQELSMKVMPLSVIFVGMILFNQLCIKAVNVSYYNVARSLTIIFNVALSYLYLGSRISPSTALCLIIIMSGFYVGTTGEIDFSLFGTLAGVISSIFVSLNSIYTKTTLPHVNGDKWLLTYVNNANACILFIPLIAYYETDILIENFEKFQMLNVWIGLCVSGMLGFVIGIVTVMQIDATSPLTHIISGTAKSAFQSFLAFYIWGNTATAGAIAGILLTLGGSTLYTFNQRREAEKKQSLPKTSIIQGGK